MFSLNCICFAVFQVFVLQGTISTNYTSVNITEEMVERNGTMSTSLPILNNTETKSTHSPISDRVTKEPKSANETDLSAELRKIFHGTPTPLKSNETNHSNSTVISCFDETLFNSTCDDFDLFKGNYTLVSEVNRILNGDSIIRTVDTAAIAAAICLVSAVIGYFSCVGYRRYLQKKYGESQILAREDVYDTKDLRYFEI